MDYSDDNVATILCMIKDNQGKEDIPVEIIRWWYIDPGTISWSRYPHTFIKGNLSLDFG
jgi:hypothetical protein